GAIKIAWQTLTQPVFDRWTHRLGFGERTGIDLPGELPGRLLPFKDWSGTSIMNIPVGEGVAVTPLQMAALYAAIANHGVWERPQVLDRIAGSRPPRLHPKRLFSTATARQLTGMLEKVVESGTGVEADVPGYTEAGKTGTTQKIDPKTGRYCGGTDGVCQYQSSFVGFAPARHPRVVVLVMVDEPQGAYYGAAVAGRASRELAARALRVLDVPPDDTKPAT